MIKVKGVEIVYTWPWGCINYWAWLIDDWCFYAESLRYRVSGFRILGVEFEWEVRRG